MSYDSNVSKVPAVAITTRAADQLSTWLRKDPEVRLYFKTSCRMLPPVTSHNVLGEIRGVEKPEEIIVVGGHLDSWDLSAGAHDDGAGCAQSIEALRLIRQLGMKPKRTIRVVLFMDEENGGTGGRDYARSENRKGERHLAAVESDRGGFLPLGIGIGAKGAGLEKIRSWEPVGPGNIGGRTWTSLNHNYGVTQFYHGAPFPDGKSYLGGTQDKNAAGNEVHRVQLIDNLAPAAKQLAVLDAAFSGYTGLAIRIECSEPSSVLLLRGTKPGLEPGVLFQTVPIAITPRR
jgi:hypothetical protein